MHTRTDTAAGDYTIDTDQLHELKEVIEISKEEAHSLKVMRSLSDPTKFKIFLSLYRVRELSVGDLSALLKLSQSAVSHALADLKMLGVVDCRRCGQLKCYTLTSDSRTLSFQRFLNRVRQN